MKKIDFPLIADVLFYGVAAFFLSVGFLRYFKISLALSVALACLFALSAAGIVFLIAYRNHRKRNLSKKEREERDALLLHLALEKEERVRAALLLAFKADGKENAHCEGDGLEADGLYLPRFSMQPISADEIAKLIREYHGSQFTLVCNDLTAEAEKLLDRFGLKTMKGNEIYSLFSRTDTVPSPLILGEVPRKSAKRTFRRIFSKKSARPFFTSGILLLFMSLFTFFPVCYLVSGTVLMLLAVTVRSFGYAQST